MTPNTWEANSQVCQRTEGTKAKTLPRAGRQSLGVGSHQFDDMRADCQRQKKWKKTVSSLSPHSESQHTGHPAPCSLGLHTPLLSASFWVTAFLQERLECSKIILSACSYMSYLFSSNPRAVIWSSPPCRDADEYGASREHRCSSWHEASQQGVWELPGLWGLHSRVIQSPLGFLVRM